MGKASPPRNRPHRAPGSGAKSWGHAWGLTLSDALGATQSSQAPSYKFMSLPRADELPQRQTGQRFQMRVDGRARLCSGFFLCCGADDDEGPNGILGGCGGGAVLGRGPVRPILGVSRSQ